MIGALLDRLDMLEARLRRGRAVNVNDSGTKELTIATGTFYFSQCRPHLTEILGDSERLSRHDEKWQQLIRLAHGNNARATYRRLLRELKKDLVELNVDYLAHLSNKGLDGQTLSDLTPAEELIIRTLEDYVPSAAASYRQGLLDLQAGERLSYRGTASEFREALRETLDHLAPDNEVQQAPGFTPEPGQTKPTMKQKVRFILSSRDRKKTQQQAAEKSVELVEELMGTLTRALYNRASLATHLESSRLEVQRIKRYVDTVFFDLLEISD